MKQFWLIPMVMGMLCFGSTVEVGAWQAKPAADEELAEPEDVRVDVKLAGTKFPMTFTYYPSKLKKDAIPVICLHGFNGSRADYGYLASVLQEQGHAVVVPDLRGHGDSHAVVKADGRREEIDPKKMTGKEFDLLIHDIDELKSWLLEKNNAGELNLEALVVIGADMTTVTAMNWSLRDWKAPQLINYKNGQDVKALVLLTPLDRYKNSAPIKLAMADPAVGHRLSVFVAVGKKDLSAFSEAKRIVNQLQRQHLEQDTDKKPEDLEVVFYPVDTNLQGTELISPKFKDFPTVDRIAKFIDFRVKSRIEDFAWSERKKP